ncbi:hypothetical protein E2C01_082467 [Portunus trituberculatus]|uniref:Uncharacterized protein n=1 Tax=Portunus trituberculatus TaxID=210409 RepID=A0A5B7IQ07_PORTR|nr:hypothetical protein [Portunus trituberculatus]
MFRFATRSNRKRAEPYRLETNRRLPPGATGFAASSHTTSGTSRAPRERSAALYNTLEEPRRLDRPRLAHNINGTDGRDYPFGFYMEVIPRGVENIKPVKSSEFS